MEDARTWTGADEAFIHRPIEPTTARLGPPNSPSSPSTPSAPVVGQLVAWCA